MNSYEIYEDVTESSESHPESESHPGHPCHPGHPGRYFYFCLFVAMITHRALRDEQRCAKKYGATWEKYIKARSQVMPEINREALELRGSGNERSL